MGEKTINQQLASQVEQLNGRVNERAKQESEASQAMAVQLQVGRVSTLVRWENSGFISGGGQKGHFALPPPPSD